VTDAPDPLRAALRDVHSALQALRLQAFTGVLWGEWRDGALVRVWSEGVSTFAPCTPPLWSHAHTAVLRQLRASGGWPRGHLRVDLQGGVPLDSGRDCPLQ
jgi:hypothetical protein